MNANRIHKLTLAAISLVLAASLPASADLIQNGSFEDGTLIPYGPSYDFQGLAAGSTNITGWTLVGSGFRVVDYIGTYWQASDGSRSVDLDGYLSGNGGIEQVIGTVVGHTYVVTFDMAGNPDGDPTTKTMAVSAYDTDPLTPLATQSFSVDSTGDRSLMGWSAMEFSFTADAVSTTLRFMSTTSGSGYGPVLDNVAIHTPLPGAVLLGFLGLGAAGMKLRRLV